MRILVGSIAGRFNKALMYVAAVLAFVVGFVTPVSALSGEKPASFRKCVGCHQVGEGAKNGVGPHLNSLDTRRIASVGKYRYSKALKAYAEENEKWNPDALDAFIEKPRKYLRGTKMNFPGLKDAEQRSKIVAWLLHTDDPASKVGPNASREFLGAEVAALEGDVEYGEYLSGECITCHLPGGADGIPTISGWETRTFIHALFEYKQEVRKNPVMITVTKRLGDEEMAALAAYFGSLEVN